MIRTRPMTRFLEGAQTDSGQPLLYVVRTPRHRKVRYREEDSVGAMPPPPRQEMSQSLPERPEPVYPAEAMEQAQEREHNDWQRERAAAPIPSPRPQPRPVVERERPEARSWLTPRSWEDEEEEASAHDLPHPQVPSRPSAPAGAQTDEGLPLPRKELTAIASVQDDSGQSLTPPPPPSGAQSDEGEPLVDLEEEEEPEEEPEEWDGTVDEDEVQDPEHEEFIGSYSEWYTDEGYDDTSAIHWDVSLERGFYTPPGHREPVEVYRYVVGNEGSEDYVGDWTADERRARLDGRRIAEESHQEPPDPEEAWLNESSRSTRELHRQLDRNSTVQDEPLVEMADVYGNAVGMQLEETEFEYAGTTHNAYRWNYGDGSETGPWRLNEDDARSDANDAVLDFLDDVTRNTAAERGEDPDDAVARSREAAEQLNARDREHNPNKYRMIDAVRAALPNAKVDRYGGGISSELPGGGRMDLEPRASDGVFNISFTAPGGGYASVNRTGDEAAKTWEIGTAFKKLLPVIQQSGYGVTYSPTDKRRGRVYAKILNDAGFEIENPASHSIKRHTLMEWRPATSPPDVVRQKLREHIAAINESQLRDRYARNRTPLYYAQRRRYGTWTVQDDSGRPLLFR